MAAILTCAYVTIGAVFSFARSLLISVLFHPCSPMRKSRPGERTRWLNTPNVYQKVEMLETGTNDPKTIYKVTRAAGSTRAHWYNI